MRRCFFIISFLFVFLLVSGSKLDIYADQQATKSSVTATTTEELSPKSKLSRLIYKCRFLKEEKYTKETWKDFSAELSLAEKVFADSHSTNQDYEKSLATLESAKENLKSQKKALLKKLIIWLIGGSIVVLLPFVVYGITQYKVKK
ncbi:hypothetical protein ACTNBL_04935 [Enterococcus villorum]|uniref:Uncharacterized protein n=2 Tax=Enterococcus villorum TaxID=112904 RepID=A0A511J5F4_9ENTE|nr:hypothetical protein [Enterococcus villorum]EOH92306.1 hypothetical protein UAO_00459 [Enterococcus villorum ATCC 700913]EOW75675.1 hypothetical protein I591_02768 [Enterococcus villorum ATCC 700913]GEL93232.1 hypothetical protein EVI01_25690 [Enterococcus villorum]